MDNKQKIIISKIELKYEWLEPDFNSEDATMYKWEIKDKKNNNDLVNIGETEKFKSRINHYTSGRISEGKTNRDWFKLNKKNRNGLHKLKVLSLKINGDEYVKDNKNIFSKDESKGKFFRRFLENYCSIIENKKLFNKNERSKKSKK